MRLSNGKREEGVKRWLRCCIALLCLVLLGGCAYIYNYRVADWWLRWYIERYVPWDDAQEQRLHARLTEQLRWHQSTQLPRYRIWLQAAREDFAGVLTVPQLRQGSEQLQQFWNDSLAQVAPDISALLADLSDAQVRKLVERLREEQAERVEELTELSPKQLHKRRVRNMRRALDGLLGDLTEKQRKRIDTWAAAVPDRRDLWLASREGWIDAFEQALAERTQRAEFDARIHALFVAPRDHWQADYRAAVQEDTERVLRLLAELHASLSAEQLAQLDKNLQKWLQRIDELAAVPY